MPIRILIAEDNHSVRTAMRQVLENVGDWEIVEAENGQEAVAKAEELKPNLVILDLAMPRLDGLSAAREIAKILPDVPIMMHTLYFSEQVELEAGKFGVRKIVPKSDSNVLVSAVQDVLQKKLPPALAVGGDSVSPVPLTVRRRTEDKIRELCIQLFALKDDETGPIFTDLQKALHQHIEHLRARVVEYPAVVERRARIGIPVPEITAPQGPQPEVSPAGNKIVPIAIPEASEGGPGRKTSSG